LSTTASRQSTTFGSTSSPCADFTSATRSDLPVARSVNTRNEGVLRSVRPSGVTMVTEPATEMSAATATCVAARSTTKPGLPLAGVNAGTVSCHAFPSHQHAPLPISVKPWVNSFVVPFSSTHRSTHCHSRECAARDTMAGVSVSPTGGVSLGGRVGGSTCCADNAKDTVRRAIETRLLEVDTDCMGRGAAGWVSCTC